VKQLFASREGFEQRSHVFAPAKTGELVPKPKFSTENFESRANSLWAHFAGVDEK